MRARKESHKLDEWANRENTEPFLLIFTKTENQFPAILKHAKRRNKIVAINSIETLMPKYRGPQWLGIVNSLTKLAKGNHCKVCLHVPLDYLIKFQQINMLNTDLPHIDLTKDEDND